MSRDHQLWEQAKAKKFSLEKAKEAPSRIQIQTVEVAEELLKDGQREGFNSRNAQLPLLSYELSKLKRAEKAQANRRVLMMIE